MDLKNTLHRRKSSKDADENTPTVTQHAPIYAASPPRSRVYSTPIGHARSLATTGPLYDDYHSPTSPFRSSFQLAPAPLGRQSHHRTRSVSAFVPPSPSPLSASFPISASANDALSSTSTPITYVFPSSASAPPDTLTNPIITTPISPGLYPFPPVTQVQVQAQPQTQPPSTRRHSRVHSRNLSVFFPRPGSLPHTAEELENGREGRGGGEAPVSDIPPAGPNVSWRPGDRRPTSLPFPELHPPTTPLGVGFTFGGRPPRTLSSASASAAAELPIPPPMTVTTPSSSSSLMTARRGHHHKHSLSHNFFSFLEPGVNVGVDLNGVLGSDELHTLPTPTLVSPWTRGPSQGGGEDTSPVDTESTSSIKASLAAPAPSPSPSSLSLGSNEVGTAAAGRGASVIGVGQFVVGAWMWVVGQQVGSLACTGLGYWVVFDAIGVGIGRIVPRWMNARRGREREREEFRRPFGNARAETVLMFAQAVYLMFSAVYVCKETVEHVLLSAGPSGGEKHHHHYHMSDEDSGIHFPMFLLLITFLSLTSTAFLYDNHARLVNVTNVRIPSFAALIRSVLTATKRTYLEPRPTTRMGLVLSNPYIASPLFFCFAILFVALCIPSAQHEACDLVLAAVITVVTFNVAYRACAVLGTVLLQTAPPRRFSGGRMEMFLRAMKEVERHPQVVHLPPPHIWQLAAAGLEHLGGGGNGEKKQEGGQSHMGQLVVTVELHVKREMGDEEVLRLTRWAWERCMLALGGGGQGEVPEVTVGVVRG